MNAYSSNKRVFLLNFAGEESKIIRAGLVLRMPNNELCYRELVFL